MIQYPIRCIRPTRLQKIIAQFPAPHRNRSGFDQYEGHACPVLRAGIDPQVIRPALNDDVSGLKVLDFAAVQEHIDLTCEDQAVID